MQDAITIERIRQKFVSLVPMMDERMRRQWAATEAVDLGWGGVATISAATGLARNTIAAGIRELEYRVAHPKEAVTVRIRSSGGGRKRLTEIDPGLQAALETLVDPATRGHPESPLRWTCKSTSKLAEELQRQNHPVTDRTVVSVDTKKKELVGEFKNAGQEWERKGKPKTVNVHDFPDKKLGKAIPDGVYDLASNEGWVSVGINHDTAHFAAASIRRWWQEMGSERFPRATKLMITADGGGSNSSRSRLWKLALQDLADDLKLPLHRCHFPPGTSKWNKIEHRLFCFITKNWRGRPLTSYEVIVNLIGNTTTTTGLMVKAALDTNHYETGIEVSDEELTRINLTRAKFHGKWNYTIRPHQ